MISNEAHFGYGRRRFSTLRRPFTRSDMTARRAQRAAHDPFTDKSNAPSTVGRTAEEMLAEIDTALSEAGFVRVESPVKRIRLIQSTKTWRLRPAARSAYSIIW